MKAWPSKAPGEVVKYSYDWTPDLADTEIITAATATPLVAAGTTIVGEAAFDDKHVTVEVSGGNDGEEASIKIEITTSDGEDFYDVVALPIIEKIVAAAHPGDYTLPTTANLVATFPEFGSVSATNIDFYLKRASLIVDQTWPEDDYGFALMLLAAHYLTLRGLGDTPEAKAVLNGSDQFRSIAIGSLRLERFDQSAALVAGRFGVTTYGRQFRIILRANKGGARVTGANLGGWGDGDRSQRGPWTY